MRIGLFLLTNIAVVFVASITMKLLGIEPYLQQSGLNLTSLLIFCAIIGFSGSLISLFISKWMAKRSTGTKIIENPSTPDERWLFETTRELAAKANIDMPEVGIFPAQESNAFATGWNKNKALVSLMQGVVNTFVMFFARIIGYTVDRVVFKNERGHGIGFYVVTIVAEIVLGILASLIVRKFSRYREYRADHAGATLADKQSMISALDRLRKEQQASIPSSMPDTLQAFGIRGGMKQRLGKLMATHPSPPSMLLAGFFLINNPISSPDVAR